MSLRSVALVAALSAGLLGCGSAENAAAPAAAEPKPSAGTVLDPQLQALEKAKAVQATLDAQAEKTRAAIDDASD